MFAEVIQKIKNSWVAKGFLIFDAVIIIVLIAMIIINNLKTVTIEVNVAPADAVVKIGGTTYENGVYKILPKSGKVEISHDGFESQSFEVDLGANSYVRIETYLMPSDGDLNYYIETGHDDDLEILRSVNADIGDEKVTEFLEGYDKKAGIIDELPILEQTYLTTNTSGVMFNISNNNGKNCKYINLCLLVQPMINVTESDVRSYIKNMGYDPDDYEITYEENVSL